MASRGIVLVGAFSASFIMLYIGVVAHSFTAEFAGFGMMVVGAWAVAEILNHLTRQADDRRVLLHAAEAATFAGLVGSLYFGLVESNLWLGAMMGLAAAGPLALCGLGLWRLRGARALPGAGDEDA
jgi:cyanate permease